MDVPGILTELFVKPESEANKILLKVVKILLVLTLSYSIWIHFNGIIILPTEYSVKVFYNFFVTGSIFIPIVIVSLLSIAIGIIEGLVLPLFMRTILFLLRKIIGLIVKLSYQSLKNRPVKKGFKILQDFYIITIKGNKLKEGFLFSFYKQISDVEDIQKLSKEHIKFYSLVIQIMFVWIYVVSKQNICPLSIYEIIRKILEFLIWYIPLNLSFLCLMSTLSIIFKMLSKYFETGNISSFEPANL
jgi:hypothetical protein